MANQPPTTAPWSGPSTCDNPGNYQHVNYNCVNGKPVFYVASWINSDGTVTIVPKELRAPNIVDYPRPTIVYNRTLWEYEVEVGYHDTGTKAEPLVVIGSDGKLVSPGYNPGTGKWMIADADGNPIYSPSPANLTGAIPAAVARARNALDDLAALLG